MNANTLQKLHASDNFDNNKYASSEVAADWLIEQYKFSSGKVNWNNNWCSVYMNAHIRQWWNF